MEFHRSYSPLYRSYIKDQPYQDTPIINHSAISKRKNTKKKTLFDSLQSPTKTKSYKVIKLALESGPLFSSGTLEREEASKKSKKYLKLDEIPIEPEVCKDLRKMKSIQNLPETVEIPSKPPKSDLKHLKIPEKKLNPHKSKPENLKPAKSPSPEQSPKPKPLIHPKPNPVFKPDPGYKPRSKLIQYKPLNHIEHEYLTDKSSSKSSVNSIDFSVSIDFETFESNYHSKQRKSLGKDNLKKVIFSKNFNQADQELKLSVVGRKIQQESNSFILEKLVKVNNIQQSFYVSTAPPVKKEYTWLSLKPSVINFNEGVRAFKQPHRFAIEKNVMSKIRKVNSNKLLRPLLKVQ